jgi:hypothetical protein
MNGSVRLGTILMLPLLAAAQPRAVGVFMQFDSAPAAPSLEVMKSEVDHLLKPSGIAIDWRLVKENHGDEAFSRVVFLKFKGSCKSEGAAPPPNDFGTLGETHSLGSTRVQNGRVLPYSEVECDQVRRALSYLAPGAGRKERQSALGRAMARVVAHELYHVLARTTAHAAVGLARSTHSLQELIAPEAPGLSSAIEFDRPDAKTPEQ